MGMGFAAGHAEVIEFEKLSALVPEAWAEIEKLLREDVKDFDTDGLTTMYYLWDCDVWGVDSIEPEWLNTQSAFLNDEDEDVVNKRLTEYDWAFERLKADFTNATQVGDSKLSLDMCYHDSDANGDRYDEVRGAYFTVEGMYVPSEAGKALLEAGIVERKTFVSLG